MKARPILFRDEMVRAILDGTKTVTRRLGRTWARVQPGDRLWVRECHKVWHRTYFDDEDDEEADAAESSEAEYVNFRATPRVGMRRWVWPKRPPEAFQGTPHAITFLHESTPMEGFNAHYGEGPWRPSIFMPRWACRLELEVVSVTEQYGLPGTVLVEHPVDATTDRIDCAITVDEARREGFDSPRDFLGAWVSMHPDHVGPVYRIEFTRVPH